MPSAYHIDRALNLVISCGTGSIRDEDLVRHARTLRADPLFAPDMRQLVDLRFSSAADLTVPGLREIAQAHTFGAGSRRAIVASDDLAFGLARMYEMLRDDGQDQVQVFRDLDEAIAWLALADARAQVHATLGTLHRDRTLA